MCFHDQQAAEKAIKAVLLFRQVEFPLTHDIEALVELAEESGLSLPDAVDDAGLLTPYAVEARYPGSWMDITASDVQEAIETAKRKLQWAKGLIFGDKKENTGALSSLRPTSDLRLRTPIPGPLASSEAIFKPNAKVM